MCINLKADTKKECHNTNGTDKNLSIMQYMLRDV